MVRLTAFPITSVSASDIRWWEEFVGAGPEERTQKDRGTSILEKGPLGKATLMLDVQPGVINWRVVGTDRESGPDDLPQVGPYNTAAESLSDIGNKWLESADCPPLKRLAYGCVAIWKVASKEDGYRTLADLLPVVTIDPVRTTDFLYRVNRPRPSSAGVPNLIINRLSTWSVIAYGRVRLQVDGNTRVAESQPIGPLDHYVQVELDLNTSPEFPGALPAKRLRAVYAELTALADEILAKGETP
jgi:hypothetical protein